MNYRSLPTCAILFAILSSACASSVDGDATESTSEALSLSPSSILASLPAKLQVTAGNPNAAIVGRGFNRRAPVARLEFTPGSSIEAEWHEHLATDRGLCVQFEGGVALPGNSGPFTVDARVMMIKGEKSFALAQTGNVAFNSDLALPLPVDGIPIPVGAGADDQYGVEVSANTSANTANATFFAVAKGPLIQGSGGARLRQAIIDNVTQLPVAQRANAFFAQCGDTYLDEVTLGGMVALDVSILSTNLDATLKLNQQLERDLNLAGTADGSAPPADPNLLSSLLAVLHVNTSASVNGSQSVVYHDQSVLLTMRLRSMGPVLPDNLTIEQAMALVGNWGSYVQHNRADLAVMGATLKRYVGVDGSNAIGVPLPAFDDPSYPGLMEELNRYFTHHYAKLLNFGFVERVRNGNQDPNDVWYIDATHPLLPLPEVHRARELALVNAFAVAQAEQCLVALPPGSSVASTNACLNQPRLGGSARARFRGTSAIAGLLAGDETTIDVTKLSYNLDVHNGQVTLYPPLNERKGRVVIDRTWDDFEIPLRSGGNGASISLHEDQSAEGCLIGQQQDDVVLISGRMDDGNPFTGSTCRFRLWNDVPFKKGWSAKASWDTLGPANSGFPQTTVSHPTGISGSVVADHELSAEVGARLHAVILSGPLSEANDFAFDTFTRALDYAIEQTP